jgi:hypothetical protein
MDLKEVRRVSAEERLNWGFPWRLSMEWDGVDDEAGGVGKPEKGGARAEVMPK